MFRKKLGKRKAGKRSRCRTGNDLVMSRAHVQCLFLLYDLRCAVNNELDVAHCFNGRSQSFEIFQSQQKPRNFQKRNLQCPISNNLDFAEETQNPKWRQTPHVWASNHTKSTAPGSSTPITQISCANLLLWIDSWQPEKGHSCGSLTCPCSSD